MSTVVDTSKARDLVNRVEKLHTHWQSMPTLLDASDMLAAMAAEVDLLRALNAFAPTTKVIDEEGRPAVVFHGTNKTFSTFTPSKTGSFGPGIYFADTENSAVEFGGFVVRALVALQHPWVIAADCDGDVNLEEEFDGPAAEAVLLLPKGRKLLDAAKGHLSGHFGQDLQAHLIELGHDGVIATYPDGSKEIVAFETHQVHIIDRAPAGTGLRNAS